MLRGKIKIANAPMRDEPCSVFLWHLSESTDRLPAMRLLPLLVIILICSASRAADPTTAAPSASYPLITCVVSGDKLGAMGSPVIINYNGTEVRFCCHDCVESFRKDPAKYLAKLNVTPQK